MGPALNGHAQMVSEQKVNHSPTSKEEPPHVGEEGRDGVEPPAIQERTSPGVCCDIKDGYLRVCMYAKSHCATRGSIHKQGNQKKKKKKCESGMKKKCSLRGSNSRPSDYETDALPAALRKHLTKALFIVCFKRFIVSS